MFDRSKHISPNGFGVRKESRKDNGINKIRGMSSINNSFKLIFPVRLGKPRLAEIDRVCCPPRTPGPTAASICAQYPTRPEGRARVGNSTASLPLDGQPGPQQTTPQAPYGGQTGSTEGARFPGALVPTGVGCPAPAARSAWAALISCVFKTGSCDDVHRGAHTG